MTLPRILTMALSRRFSDETMRHVYPVRDYIVEGASDQRHVLLTLACGGGFDVEFGLDVRMIPALIRDLAGGQALLEGREGGEIAIGSRTMKGGSRNPSVSGRRGYSFRRIDSEAVPQTPIRSRKETPAPRGLRRRSLIAHRGR